MNVSPPPSALSKLLAQTDAPTYYAKHLVQLAETVAYNLRHEHDWTSVEIHFKSPRESISILPRPLISGVPKAQVYVHPDDQIETLARKKRGEEVRIAVDREWVLPSHIKEKWSLSRFAQCFDAIGQEPPIGDDDPESLTKSLLTSRRGGKRMLLATLSEDSTVVYYVVHDGIVKPRQN